MAGREGGGDGSTHLSLSLCLLSLQLASPPEFSSSLSPVLSSRKSPPAPLRIPNCPSSPLPSLLPTPSLSLPAALFPHNSRGRTRPPRREGRRGGERERRGEEERERREREREERAGERREGRERRERGKRGEREERERRQRRERRGGERRRRGGAALRSSPAEHPRRGGPSPSEKKKKKREREIREARRLFSSARLRLPGKPRPTTSLLLGLGAVDCNPPRRSAPQSPRSRRSVGERRRGPQTLGERGLLGPSNSLSLSSSGESHLC